MQLQGGIRVDLVGHELTGPDGTVRSLTVLEADALRMLGEAGGQPVKRGELERQVWGFRAGTRSEAVPVAMRRLRAKVGDALETVRGVGWRLHTEVASVPLEATPLPSTTWFPREALEAALSEVLGHRPVAVVGAGGHGKTRLVRAVVPDAHRLVPLPPGRVDAPALRGAIAAALGLATVEPAGVEGAWKERDEAVLWLDGAHALDDEAAAWLGRLPRSVVTVREAPRSGGLAVVEVPAMAEDEARAFFRERCAPTVMEPSAEGGVLRMCSGHPGMLERAASLAWMGAELVLAELESEQGEDPFVVHAWSELSDAGRSLLRVASAVGGPVAPRDLRGLVPSLAPVPELRRRALLQADAAGHLVVPPAVQRFVERRPDPDGDRQRTRSRVVAWATAATEALARDPRPALERLKALRPTLEAVTAGPDTGDLAPATLALSLGLAHFGRTQERVDLLRATLQRLPEDHPDAAALRRQLAWALRAVGEPRRVFEALVDGDDHPSAVRLRAMGAYAAGEHERALALLDDVVERAAPGTITHIYARVQRASRQDAGTRRDPALREADLQAALEQAETLRLCLPEVLRSTGRVRRFDGDGPAARRLIARAIDMAEANGQHHKLGELWNSLGVCLAESDPAAASEAFRTALDRMKRIGNTLVSPSVRCNLALCQYVSGDVEGARASLKPMLAADDATRGQQLAWLLALACDTALGDIGSVRWRSRIDAEELGRPYGRDARAHGEALLRLAEAAADVRRGGSVELKALLADIEPLTQEPPATALRMLRDHARRTCAS